MKGTCYASDGGKSKQQLKVTQTNNKFWVTDVITPRNPSISQKIISSSIFYWLEICFSQDPEESVAGRKSIKSSTTSIR